MKNPPSSLKKGVKERSRYYLVALVAAIISVAWIAPEPAPWGQTGGGWGETGEEWTLERVPHLERWLRYDLNAGSSSWISYPDGTDFTQIEGAYQAELTATGMDFDDDDRMESDTVGVHSTSRGLSVYAVVDLDVDTGLLMIASKYLTTDDNREWGLSSSYARVQETGGYTDNSYTAIFDAATGLQLLELHWTPGDTVRAYRNGAHIASSTDIVNDITAGSGDVSIGAQDEGGGSSMDGEIREIAIFSCDYHNMDYETDICNELNRRHSIW